MKRGIAAVFGVLIIFSATILVFAIGSTTKITITSAELQRPIEITDPEILKNTAQTGGVAYMAHIGGFLAGCVLTFVFRGSPGAPATG
jgi:membrane associated rhomboid family serine protease